MAKGNPVTWFEILGKDGGKTQKFYTDLFGWKVDANNPMSYGMVEGGEGGIGGGLSNSMDGKPSVLVYVDVDDLDKTLAKAKGLGAEVVMPPMDVPGGPKIAQFKDPDGNVIGIMKAAPM